MSPAHTPTLPGTSTPLIAGSYVLNQAPILPLASQFDQPQSTNRRCLFVHPPLVPGSAQPIAHLPGIRPYPPTISTLIPAPSTAIAPARLFEIHAWGKGACRAWVVVGRRRCRWAEAHCLLRSQGALLTARAEACRAVEGRARRQVRSYLLCERTPQGGGGRSELVRGYHHAPPNRHPRACSSHCAPSHCAPDIHAARGAPGPGPLAMCP